MFKYFLTNKAVNDLAKIWNYTVEKWSETQADNYYFNLLENCQQLAQVQSLGKNYDEIGKDIFGYKSGKHIIFYRKRNFYEIEITRILHSSMDLKNRMNDF